MGSMPMNFYHLSNTREPPLLTVTAQAQHLLLGQLTLSSQTLEILFLCHCINICNDFLVLVSDNNFYDYVIDLPFKMPF